MARLRALVGRGAPKPHLATTLAPPPPSITFRATASGVANNVSTVSVTVPASVQTGDVLLVAVTCNVNPTITPPAGWTTLNSIGQTGGSQALYWRLATVSDPNTTYVWSFSLSLYGTALLAAYSNASTVTPIDSSAGNSGNNAAGTTLTSPSPYTSQANDQVVEFWGAAKAAGGGTVTVTAPATVRGSAGGSQGSAVQTVVSDQLLPYRGPAPSQTATADFSSYWIAQTVTLQMVDHTSALLTQTAGEVLETSSLAYNARLTQLVGEVLETTNPAYNARLTQLVGEIVEATNLAYNARLTQIAGEALVTQTVASNVRMTTMFGEVVIKKVFVPIPVTTFAMSSGMTASLQTLKSNQVGFIPGY